MIGSDPDGLADLTRWLADAPQEPWGIVKIDVARWRLVNKKQAQSPIQTFREMRMAFRSLPYDNGNDSVNRRILRDAEGRQWDAHMVYHHGWFFCVRLHHNGERERL